MFTRECLNNATDDQLLRFTIRQRSLVSVFMRYKIEGLQDAIETLEQLQTEIKTRGLIDRYNAVRDKHE